ncbi:MAG: VWA domain-containing protein [Gammaproteobacteria bacterium]|nr:VWA domain-containing protein [Gammaproteobacteria bacterium]
MTMKIIYIVIPVLLAALAAVFPAEARQVEVDVALGNPVLAAEQKQTAYIKVNLRGLDFEYEAQRTQANIALVLDRSGSMRGKKIRQAREAAVTVLYRLNEEDILSVVAYDSTVQVLAPATKVSDKDDIARAIRRLAAGGSTALYAGVRRGAKEVRKFMSRNRVNRIILLSDGLANTGPKSPSALGELGATLKREGISVTTLGLGLNYNEDLMVRLADRSDGNHAFIEHASDLTHIFKQELGDVLSVVAQNVKVEISCARSIRPVRVLGREADIQGRRVITRINQLYGNQEKYVLLEVEVPPASAGTRQTIAHVEVTYRDMATRRSERFSEKKTARFTNSRKTVKESANRDVMISVAEQLAVQKSEEALRLRDAGLVRESKKLLLDNSAQLRGQARKYKSKRLKKQSDESAEEAKDVTSTGRRWKKSRKKMKKSKRSRKRQQRY